MCVQNGLAPLPKFKFDKIEADVCTTFAYLEQDR